MYSPHRTPGTGVYPAFFTRCLHHTNHLFADVAEPVAAFISSNMFRDFPHFRRVSTAVSDNNYPRICALPMPSDHGKCHRHPALPHAALPVIALFRELKRFSPRRNPDPIPNPHLHPQSSSPLYFIRFNKSPSDKTSPSFPSVPPSFPPPSSSSTFQKAGRVMAEAELAPLDTQEEGGGNRQGENKNEVRKRTGKT